jgi:hypothetical protein
MILAHMPLLQKLAPLAIMDHDGERAVKIAAFVR